MKATVIILIVILMMLCVLPATAQDSLNISLLSTLYSGWGAVLDVTLLFDYAYVATGITGIRILDVSDLERPRELDSFHAGHNVRRVFIHQEILYVFDGSKLVVYDLADRLEPAFVSEYQCYTMPSDLVFGDGIACIAGMPMHRNGERHGGGIEIINVSDLDNIVLASVYGTEFTDVWSLDILNDQVFYVDINESDFIILDVSDPENPSESAHLHDLTFDIDLAVEGDFAYVARTSIDFNSNGFYVIDIRRFDSPQIVETYEADGVGGIMIEVEGDRAYLLNGDVELQVVDISNPYAVSFTGECRIGSNDTRQILPDHGNVFASSGLDGLRFLDVSDDAEPEETGFYNDEARVGDVKLMGDYAVLACGDNGMKIVDISNPEEMEIVSVWNTEAGIYFLGIAGNYIYCAGSHEIHVIDAAAPDDLIEIADFVMEDWILHFCIQNDLAWCVLYREGLMVYDISDPEVLDSTGFYDQGETETVTIAGDYAFLPGAGGLGILDVHDPSQIEWVSAYRLYELLVGMEVTVAGDRAFLSWVVQDYSDGGLDIIDISNILEPQRIGRFVAGEFGTYAYHTELEGDHLFIAEGDDGLSVYDISNPQQPELTGFYDTDGVTGNLIIREGLAYVCDFYSFDVYNVSETLDIEDKQSIQPLSYSLLSAYPNPFNSMTTISYSVPFETQVSLQVFDVRGRLVDVLMDEVMAGGRHEVVWDGGRVSAGVYMVRMMDSGNIAGNCLKVLLLK